MALPLPTTEALGKLLTNLLGRKVAVKRAAAPAAPSRWPVDDLVDDIDTLEAWLPTTRSTAPSSIVSAMVEVPCALM